VFYIDVAKVDQDVAHVEMAIHVYFKCMFQMFHLFQTYAAIVSFGYCKTRSGCCMYVGIFIRMLQVFHLDVCICLQWLHTCFKFFLVFLQMF
jgi:hypothetical protein